MLRVAVGVPAIYYGCASLWPGEDAPRSTLFSGLAALLGGVSLVVGLLTPFAGALVGAGAAWMTLFGRLSLNANEMMMPSMIAIVAVAVVCLGPGALSIDALLFGRREIIIPRPARRDDL